MMADKPLKEYIQDPTWKRLLAPEFRQKYFKDLQEELQKEYDSGETIYPAKEKIFNAFNLLPFYEVRIVIIGQEPYCETSSIKGEDFSDPVPKATGLAFSVPYEVTSIPKTLQNIYKELEEDIGFHIPNNGCLDKWARAGVLLLNERLTVRASKPYSHEHLGWQTFTDKVIKIISDKLPHVVFMLWGNEAQNKETIINEDKHTIIKTDHPADVNGDFQNSGCFSRSNFILVMSGQCPINWRLREEIDQSDSEEL